MHSFENEKRESEKSNSKSIVFNRLSRIFRFPSTENPNTETSDVHKKNNNNLKKIVKLHTLTLQGGNKNGWPKKGSPCTILIQNKTIDFLRIWSTICFLNAVTTSDSKSRIGN